VCTHSCIVLKVNRKWLTPLVYDNSSSARFPIHSRDTAIRIYSVSRLRHQNPIVKIPSCTKLWASPDHFCILSKYGNILGKTLCSGPRRRPGRQAHGGTALARRHHLRCPWDFLGCPICVVNCFFTPLVWPISTMRRLDLQLCVTHTLELPW
jgi:hypothetical protein